MQKNKKRLEKSHFHVLNHFTPISTVLLIIISPIAFEIRRLLHHHFFIKHFAVDIVFDLLFESDPTRVSQKIPEAAQGVLLSQAHTMT